jgi:hypothetical protein
LPASSRWLRLRTEGCAGATWGSDTLHLMEDGGVHYVRLEAGRHRLFVRDLTTGERSETWIDVRDL